MLGIIPSTVIYVYIGTGISDINNAMKTKNLTIENKKLKLKKYNPVKQKHELFVEAKLPPHTK